VRYLRSFARFWWDFVVGDDWRVAAGLGLALAVTWALAHHHIEAWWFLPVAVAVILIGSVRRESRGGR